MATMTRMAVQDGIFNEKVGGYITEKGTISYTGSAAESAITLSRGTQQNIIEIDVYFVNAAAASYIQALRKDSATSANEKDITNASSVNVLIGEQYLVNGTTLKFNQTNWTAEGLRLYLSLGTSSGTVYYTVTYLHNA